MAFRWLVFSLGLALLACAAPYDFAVAETTVDKSKVRINLAGRQRMLVQRMAKSACMAHMGIARDDHLDALTGAMELFDKTHTQLVSGGGDANLPPETNQAVLARLSTVSDYWERYQAELSDYIATNNEAALETVSWLNMPMLVQMAVAVDEIERAYAKSGVDPALAKTINVAGRQRMLTQRASKEMCFMAAGFWPDDRRASLGRVVMLFDSSLENLQEGNADEKILSPITPDVREQLAVVAGLWAPVIARFDATLDSEKVAPEDLRFVAENIDEILREMNKAVGMYAKS